MTPIEQRLRTFMLVTAACICVFTVAELWLVEHMQSATQLIPFVLCGLGLATILAALLRPRRWTWWALRLAMVLLIAGSLLGMWEHLQGNIGFALEIHPNAAIGDVLWEALKGGNPLLAPGILVLAGVLGIAASYKHPALARRKTAATTDAYRYHTAD